MPILPREKLIVALIALHSLVLGTVLLLFPAAVLGFFGWSYDCATFFPAQSGLFLLLLGGAYAAGIFHRPFLWFLVATKAAAVVFLVVEVILGNSPQITILQAFADGCMGGVVAVQLRRTQPVGVLARTD